MHTERIREIFRAVEDTDPLIPAPATRESLAACQKALAERGYPILPPGAIEFFQLANGFSWNGFEFFGSNATTTESGRYTLKDIVHMNDVWHDNREGRDHLLLLGRFDDDIYVYDKDEDSFHVLDGLTLFPIDEYFEYDELFICSVNEYACEYEYEEDLDDEDWEEDAEEILDDEDWPEEDV